MFGGIKNRAFYTAALAVTSTAAKFLAVAMIIECLKQRTKFKRRPIYTLVLLKIFKDKPTQFFMYPSSLDCNKNYDDSTNC